MAFDEQARAEEGNVFPQETTGQKDTLETIEDVNPNIVDGQISIQDGKVTIKPPVEGGRWPVIKPGTNVIVKVNGREVMDKYTISADDVIEVLPADEEAICEVKVIVSSTKMQALASFHRQAGKTFRVRDIPEGPFAYVTAELIEVTTPPEPTVEDVMEKLAEAGVVFGIDQEAVEGLVKGFGTTPVVVAEGRPPGEPVDGMIRYLFTELAEKDIDPNATRIDLYDRHTIPWVQPRDVLADKTDPQAGEPGTNVYGEAIRPRNYRNPVLSVGEGVELRDEGRQAVATREGRPILDGKTIKVIPTYLVPKDADASTGHIRFSGDVMVNGDVLDRVEVISGGVVEVSGLVSHARVMGQQGVVVRKGVIGGQIRAGGISAESKMILSVVRVLILRLEELLKALQQLQRDPRMQQLKLSDGQVVKQLLESRFNEIPKRVVELEDYAAASPNLFQEVPQLTTILRNKLMGLGPTSIASRWELQPLISSLQDFALYLEAMQAADADIEVKSLQNAVLEASGKVVINGTGCYYSTILAGKGVKAPRGLLRGGKVVVNEGNVEFKELGGPGGISTEVTVVGSGVIIAQTVYPNVILSIQGESRGFRDMGRRIRAFVNEEGELIM
ncbi:MAG: DUF342 domain-containing protein [Firmicutes bacterium]|nr:DUF342 domain-containing protein [Bacillota bacterium]